ncbi:hypothetical protein BIY21_05335 [Vibrio ponticus]|uniref:DUF4123 domain-containing protein n=1 Tax=Vibrio ponticus TaxID=265668 RepID=A0ABX3F3E4_9VIBR|nr:DUF4123 domain-containing protein [Vibrio ponticus]OLQ84311.1 hypothetical protein BIY21_05335 [Vibrio ponticus]
MQKINTEQLLCTASRGRTLFLLLDINQYSEPLKWFKQLEGLEVRHLFVDTVFRQLIMQSPKLVQLNRNCADLINDVFRRHTGCIVASNLSIDELNHALGKMLIAEHETQGKVYFRFFSPAVARAIVGLEEGGHCWSHCSHLYLPGYRTEQWSEFELNENVEDKTFFVSQQSELEIKAEHFTYHLAKMESWLDKPIETVQQAMNSLARLCLLDALTSRELIQWSELIANRPELLNHKSWSSLIRQPIPKQDKLNAAVALNNTERELTHV